MAAGGPRAGSSVMSHTIGAYLALESGSAGCEGVTRDVLVDMDSLSMLAKVVKAGEPARAVALEWPLSSVFSGRALVGLYYLLGGAGIAVT